MRTSHFKPLTAAITVALGLGAAAESHASAYAVSFNHIQNGQIVALVDKGAGFVIDPTILSFGDVGSNSSASASLNGTGPALSASGSPGSPPDVDAANGTGSQILRTNEQVHGGGGVGPTGVSYVMFGRDNGVFDKNYSNADARVLSEQAISPPTLAEAHAIAETNVVFQGFGQANSSNDSSTRLTASLIAGADCAVYTCIVSFAFDANPYMFTELDPDADPGSIARSQIATSAKLESDDGNQYAFNWAMNGEVAPANPPFALPAGAITGTGYGGGLAIVGQETADSEALNRTISVLAPGNQEFSNSNAFNPFAAIASGLGRGTYTLDLAMGVRADVERVPEPATLGLLGLGLAGIGFAGRRRRALAS